MKDRSKAPKELNVTGPFEIGATYRIERTRGTGPFGSNMKAVKIEDGPAPKLEDCIIIRVKDVPENGKTVPVTLEDGTKVVFDVENGVIVGLSK